MNMAASIATRLAQAVNSFENSVGLLLRHLFRPGGPGFAVAGIEPASYPQHTGQTSDDSIFNNHVLFAVPRNRRTIEKRHKRQFGTPEYVWKMLRPNNSLSTCVHCGNWHEADKLCPHCYNKVLKETKEIQGKIEETLKLNPVEKDVIILYEDERAPEDFVQGKQIVEMEKPRPSWFAPNLLQTSTEEKNEEVKDVKPTNLA